MTDEALRIAARSLLRGGFLAGDEALDVRRHRRPLTDLFRDNLGWQVVADDHGPVRTLCLPGAGHEGRGLSTRSGRRFDPQRYALFFLVAAALETAGARTTLRVLFDDVRGRAAEIDDFDFDDQRPSHRRAYVHAVHAAVDLGILELAEGSEDDFANRGEGDALYRVDRTRLARLLATSKPPSLSATAAAATDEHLYAETDDGKRRQRRHRVLRALVAEPVVYRDDLSDEEVDYLKSQEGRIRRVLGDLFGLDLEVRAEGWVAVDPAGKLTDLRFPEITPARAAALAIVDASRGRRDSDGTATWTAEDLHDYVSSLGDQFGASWTVAPDDDAAVHKVVAEATDVLAAMRLASISADGEITMRAAAGRFALDAPLPDPSQSTLDPEPAP